MVQEGQNDVREGVQISHGILTKSLYARQDGKNSMREKSVGGESAQESITTQPPSLKRMNFKGIIYLF